MRVEHLAIDGAVVAIEAEADLSTKSTATGWAIVPSLMRAYPFTICPAGHSAVVEETVKSSVPAAKILSTEEYSLKGGNLRIAEVELPTATGETRTLTVGAWEGAGGCLTTSLVGSQREQLIEVFDTLRFSERPRGLAIDSPVTPRPREPEVIKEIPKLGVLNIRPAISSTLEQVPKARGRVTDYGELFRIRASSNALMFVGNSAVVKVDPLPNNDPREMLAIAQNLRVEWLPGAGR
jgi:hypothetical protein